MKVQYFALLRNATHKREETWTRPAADVRGLLTDLCTTYVEPFAKWVMENGELAKFVVVLVDGPDVRSLAGLDTPLADTSEIAVFPPLAGG